MANLTAQDRERYVRDVFTRIAARYDLMNRLMTGGQDVSWRREVIARADLHPGDHLLDLGAGTGDLAREALRQQSQAAVVAADFTLKMMTVGKISRPELRDWNAADALHLPYPDASFDVIVSGYLLRNVSDIQQALREQYRVLRPGGRIVALDTTRPRKNWLYPFISFYLHTIIPALGWLLTRQRDAYTYLPDSTEHFLRAEELAARMATVGFREVVFRRRMFGTMAIHWAKK